MEQILITVYQKEDLKNLITESFRQVFSENNNTEKDHSGGKEEILLIDDVQRIFRVSKVTIHKWKKMGLLPFYKMGRKVYFKRSEVIDSLSKKRRKLEF